MLNSCIECSCSGVGAAWIEDGQEDLEQSFIEHMKYIAGLGKPFYAPFASTPEDLKDIRRMDNNELIPTWYSPISIGSSINGYFRNQEHKANNGNQRGIMQPRDCAVGSIAYVGKEINSVQLEIAEATGGLMGNLLKNTQYENRLVLENYSTPDLVLISGLSGQAINQIRARKINPTPQTRKLLREATSRLENNPLQWRKVDNEILAELLCVPVDVIKNMKYGKHRFTPEQQKVLLEI